MCARARARVCVCVCTGMCACGRGGIPCDSPIDWVTIHSPLAVNTVTVGTLKRSNNIPLCYSLLSIIYLTTRNVRQHELLLSPRLGKENTGPFPPRLKAAPPHINITEMYAHVSSTEVRSCVKVEEALLGSPS